MDEEVTTTLIDFPSIFPYIWDTRFRPRDEPTSTIRDSLSDPWFHHVELLGKRDHFSTSISTATADSPVSMDGSSLPRSNAHPFRALSRRDAHGYAPLLSHTKCFRRCTTERTGVQRRRIEPGSATCPARRFAARCRTCSIFSCIGKSLSGRE